VSHTLTKLLGEAISLLWAARKPLFVLAVCTLGSIYSGRARQISAQKGKASLDEANKKDPV